MKLRALVVDDSRVMRMMVMESLRKTSLAEFEFLEAEDGEKALEKFNPKKVDIVFADWNMPNMSGVDLVRAIRATGKSDHIPIIMVTSEKTLGKMDEALDDAGANAFISKPFTVDYMIQKIGGIVDTIEANQKGGGSKFYGNLVG